MIYSVKCRYREVLVFIILLQAYSFTSQSFKSIVSILCLKFQMATKTNHNLISSFQHMHTSTSNIIILILFILPFIHAKEDYIVLDLTRSYQGGEYFTTIYLGSPAQSQSVIIDNLSNMLLLNCQGCISCKYSNRSQPFRPQASFSNKNIECKDQLAICNSHCKGRQSSDKCQPKYYDYFGEDNIRLESDIIALEPNMTENAVRGYFGCVNTEVADYYHQENGVLGLTRSSVNIFNALLGLKDTQSIQQWGFCFNNNKGFAEIGSLPQRNFDNFTELTMHEDQIFGARQLVDITFGKSSFFNEIYLKNTGLIFATRSTETVFPTASYELIIKNIKARCNDSSCNVSQLYQQSHRKNMTCLSFASEIQPDEVLPPFQFVFLSNNSLQWKASEYMIKGQAPEGDQSGRAYYCLAFTNSSRMQKYALGLNYLQNKHIIFDLKSSRILLNQNSDCSYYKSPFSYALLKYIPYLIILVLLCFKTPFITFIRKLRGYSQPDLNDSKLDVSNKNMLEMK